jgi:hypothetical protein
MGKYQDYMKIHMAANSTLLILNSQLPCWLKDVDLFDALKSGVENCQFAQYTVS